MDATRFQPSQSAPQIPTWDIVLSPPQSPGLALPPNDHGFAGSLLSECFSGTGLPSDAFDSYLLPDEMNGLDFEDRRFLFTTDTGQGSGSLSGLAVSMQHYLDPATQPDTPAQNQNQGPISPQEPPMLTSAMSRRKARLRHGAPPSQPSQVPLNEGLLGGERDATRRVYMSSPQPYPQTGINYPNGYRSQSVPHRPFLPNEPIFPSRDCPNDPPLSNYRGRLLTALDLVNPPPDILHSRNDVTQRTSLRQFCADPRYREEEVLPDPLDCNTPVVHSKGQHHPPLDKGKDLPLQSSITAARSRTQPSPSAARRHLFHDWPPSISPSPRPPRENEVTTTFRWLDENQTPLPTDSLRDNSLSWQLPEFDFYVDTTWPSPHESPSIEQNVVNVASPSPSHIQPPLLVDGRYSPPHVDNLHNRTSISLTPNSSNHNSCAATSSGGLFPALALPPEGIISPLITNNPRPKHAPRVPPSGGSLSAAAAASALSSASILASALASACSEGGQVEHSSILEQGTGSRERGTDYLGKASACDLDPEMLPVFPGGLMGTNPAIRGVLLQTSHKLLLEMCRCLHPGAHSRQALDSRGPIGRQKLSDGWTKSTRGTDGGAGRPHVSATELCRGGTREQALKLRALLVEVERHYGIYREKLHPLVLAFSAVAGHPDAAHCYTTPPLVAVSTAFRRIKDAILTELHQMAT